MTAVKEGNDGQPATGSQECGRQRRVWLLEGPKAGDNAQVRALGAALRARGGWQLETKTLQFHGAELLAQLVRVPNRLGLIGPGRSALVAPWPDLVIGAGRRSEPVARWIRRAALASGAAAPRLVHLGRPWSRPAQFDLVVSSRQYELPSAANVLSLALPLTALPPPSVPETPDSSVAVFAGLPRPWIGVLLGGDSGYLIFDATRARELATSLAAARGTGGLVIVGSPRTPAAFLNALAAALDGSARIHPFVRGGANPYRDVLATADRLVVTSDSVSMVLEAATTGVPTYLHDVRPRGGDWWRHRVEYRWRALSHRLVQALAPRCLRRDVRALHAALITAGHLRWLADGLAPFTPVPLDPPAALGQVADRVEKLVGNPGDD